MQILINILIIENMKEKIAILINLIIVYLVLISLKQIERVLGKSGLMAIRKFFGVILLAIAVKIFTTNVGALGI